MMKITRRLLVPVFVAIIAVSTTACQSTGWGDKQTGGTLLGAGLGAFIGSQLGSGKGQLAAVALGAVLGAWAGNEFGASLDRADRTHMELTMHSALEYNRTGFSSEWHNRDSGHYGSTIPLRTRRNIHGYRYCREFQTHVTVGGRTERAYGTGCRQSDGSWRIVSR